MLMKRKLGEILLLLVLGYNSLFGLPMDPQEIEELMDGMNQTQIEMVVEHDDNGEP